MLVNCAPLLSRYWIPALVGLIDELGPENLYVSILENGSVDDTRELLMGLQKILMGRRMDFTFRFENDRLLKRLLGGEGMGDNWIKTENGWLPRRISYLAELRNMVLEPLQNSSRYFDKVLFLNDVIFSVC